MPEREERQRQRHHGVDRPRMQPPMEEGDLHGLAGGGGIAALADWRRHEVHDGFGHAEEHQTDAHAGGEQHREPREIAVVRFTVVGAQLDVAVTADRQERDRQQDDGHDQDVEPAGIAEDPALHCFEQVLRGLRGRDGKADE
ncbi:hypothetical protein G6F31_018237 [Rhizopus arrhizus]|nr:hypothetical protein G6F31_018237 [Rhizopus arrhizus]